MWKVNSKKVHLFCRCSKIESTQKAKKKKSLYKSNTYKEMEDFENAVLSFQRLLNSSRVRDDYKEKIKKVIKAIEDHKANVDRNKPIELPDMPKPKGG